MGPRLRAWTESGDLALEAQQEAWRSLDGKSFPNLAAFRGWLLKILRHLAASESHRRGMDMVEGAWSRIPGDGRTPSQGAAVLDSRNWIRDRLEILTERERAVVLARIVDGETFGALSERFGISEGNARVIFHRSLQRLRKRDEFGQSP